MSSLFTIGKPKRIIREHITNVTNWIKDILQQTLGLQTVADFDSTKIHIMVSEIECNAPDCVPLETFVVVFGNTESSSSSSSSSRNSRWTGNILKPVDEVTKQDVMQLLISTDILDIVVPSTMQLNDSNNMATTPDGLNIATNTIDNDINVFTKPSNQPTQSQSQHHSNLLLKQIESYLNQIDDPKEQISQIESVELLLQSYRLKLGKQQVNISNSKNNDTASITTDAVDDDVVIVVSMVNNTANRTLNNQSIKIANDTSIVKNNTSILPSVSSHTVSTPSLSNNNNINITQSSSNSITTNAITTSVISSDNTTIMTPTNPTPPIITASISISNNTTISTTNTKRQFNNITTSSRITTTASSATSNKPWHEKGGVRPRGCPCCDPDNLDNLVDKLLFLEAMP